MNWWRERKGLSPIWWNPSNSLHQLHKTNPWPHSHYHSLSLPNSSSNDQIHSGFLLTLSSEPFLLTLHYLHQSPFPLQERVLGLGPRSLTLSSKTTGWLLSLALFLKPVKTLTALQIRPVPIRIPVGSLGSTRIFLVLWRSWKAMSLVVLLRLTACPATTVSF